ncbi:uncharacterized protein N7482_005443 [Penicillium canariense]|uniref:Uncharacterized protein n=1 Tax=Penicillium canariense TaxID=189055 RepID=A0A9W9LMJ9_9EURO|nr:uncharacterized protein N7482_005443 [Penicillium canariense]KAJ5166662.1 hypothetical protein N7482_005443 [Penicillium canariense]
MLSRLYTLFLVTFLATFIMALSPRDAIHLDELDRYDTFLSSLTDSQFLDMYLEDNQVKIDVYHHPSNEIARSESFTPSSSATQYFAQESTRANELETRSASEDTKDDAGIQSRDAGRGCVSSGTAIEGDIDGLEQRLSRCYQFCGSIANCRGNNGCPHCYAVRQGCLWQKWCR